MRRMRRERREKCGKKKCEYRGCEGERRSGSMLDCLIWARVGVGKTITCAFQIEEEMMKLNRLDLAVVSSSLATTREYECVRMVLWRVCG